MIEVAPNEAVTIVNGTSEQDIGVDDGDGFAADVLVIVDNDPGEADDALYVAPRHGLVVVNGPDDIQVVEVANPAETSNTLDEPAFRWTDPYDAIETIDVSGDGVVIVHIQP